MCFFLEVTVHLHPPSWGSLTTGHYYKITKPVRQCSIITGKSPFLWVLKHGSFCHPGWQITLHDSCCLLQNPVLLDIQIPCPAFFPQRPLFSLTELPVHLLHFWMVWVAPQIPRLCMSVLSVTSLYHLSRQNDTAIALKGRPWFGY